VSIQGDYTQFLSLECSKRFHRSDTAHRCLSTVDDRQTTDRLHLVHNDSFSEPELPTVRSALATRDTTTPSVAAHGYIPRGAAACASTSGGARWPPRRLTPAGVFSMFHSAGRANSTAKLRTLGSGFARMTAQEWSDHCPRETSGASLPGFVRSTYESVSDAAHCLDVSAAGAKLLAQAFDVGIDRTCRYIGSHAPHPIQQR
jgi:hypothetical protein